MHAAQAYLHIIHDSQVQQTCAAIPRPISLTKEGSIVA